MTKVKICGLMEREHVNAAVDAGADAIGFVFAPSSRRVTVEQAQELAREIPDNVLKIGVFVNETQEEITRIFKAVPLDYVQFHGDEDADFIRKMQLPSIKALSVKSTDNVKEASEYETNYYLFDAPGTVYKGGSGVTFDWELLKAAEIPAEKIILAGGLNIGNVKEAVQRVRPFMVDVSSGVERGKRKDKGLIQEFIQAVKEGVRF
ncbi:phosphoribosylanthranilate isomerase [Sporosarcina jiandibaonis]|uniref:phosphoribosylanthranilate isomerase n=1 Tax=Sporosarcina jiandibaonis TaxID=2715535 RepID=UPI0015538CF1|nr:phosphoribosylanthranilate isomerase [Sporosarcina jiandibaonis]